MSLPPCRRRAAIAGLFAGPWFAVALLVFAARVPEYRHALHPPALLGATGMPDALAWNLLGFVVPGLLAAVALQALHGALRAARANFVARIGATVLLLSALAFVAQGLLPLRLGQALDAGPARMHVVAWMLWWLAALAGFALLAAGLRRQRLLAGGAVLAAIAMAIALHAIFVPLPGGVRELLARVAWFAWIACAGLARQP
ncbi:MAG TPA: DUF998 domain-containing protein [Xanthomonadaceae bacterium]|nr:DUF998 domain-containing protein [Xanthomonadaceae bacterium]